MIGVEDSIARLVQLIGGQAIYLAKRRDQGGQCFKFLAAKCLVTGEQTWFAENDSVP